MDFVSVVRNSSSSGATVVLLHGLGSDEQDMLGFAQTLDPDLEIICVRAPIAYGPGYTWFDIQWTNKGIEIDENQYWKSVDAVCSYLSDLAREKLIIGGFSQGAMMSLGVISRSPSIAKAALLLSGRGLVGDLPPFEGSIFHAHGTYDDVISIQDARKLHETLLPLGDKYEYHEYEMGHWINEKEVEDLNLWFSKLEI